ncbi:hypothetical protein [Micromonospora sp. MH99]|uniref:hypothetical protein n=1 Tax=Micromonospora sp. MH99 TaxID=1945510 RepID=UPI001F1F205D|nr:hypothetical protein [Micromonospora sp. MH99]MCF0094159.1 hypothetical protein [Micromonospora sp. MH99]
MPREWRAAPPTRGTTAGHPTTGSAMHALRRFLSLGLPTVLLVLVIGAPAMAL